MRLASKIILRLFHENRLKLTARDYVYVLKRCGPDDVCFVDPPYLGAKVSTYTDNTLNHAKMIEMLIRAKFRWVLSEYEHPIYDHLTQIFGPPVKIRVQKVMNNANHTNGTRGGATECLWKNF